MSAPIVNQNYALFHPASAEFCGMYFRQKYPDLAEKLNGRIERAQVLAVHGTLQPTPEQPDIWRVRSDSKPNHYYEVIPSKRSCSCPDAQKGNLCKHRLAVGFILKLNAWYEDFQAQTLAQAAEVRQQLEAHARKQRESEHQARLFQLRKDEADAWHIAREAINAYEEYAARLMHTTGFDWSDERLTQYRETMLRFVDTAVAATQAVNQHINNP